MMRSWIAFLATALLAGAVLAAEDSTAPTFVNLSISPTALVTTTGPARAAVCAQVSDSESGLQYVYVVVAAGSKTFRAAMADSQMSSGGCGRSRVNENVTCTESGAPATCCTGPGTGNCPGLPTCNAGAAGTCHVATDCTAADNCSTGGGSSVEVLTCNGSSWAVRSTAAHPNTSCRVMDALPRWAPGGTYDVDAYAVDGMGNTATLDGGTVSNTP